MKNLSLNKILIVAVFVFTYIYVVIIQRLPVTYLLLVYLVLGVILLAAFYSHVLAFIGNYFFIAGKTDKAVKIYNRALSKSSKNATVYLNYAILLVREGKAAEALEVLKKSEGIKKKKLITEKNILLTMGSCYWVLGEIDKAIHILEGMRNRYDYVNNHVLTTLGYMYLIKNDLDNALDCTQKAIKDTPNSGSAWDNLGQIYLKQNKFHDAKEAFNKAVGYNSNLADSYYYLGVISLQEENPDEALAHFERAKQCSITLLNTVTLEQIDEKINEIKSE